MLGVAEPDHDGSGRSASATPSRSDGCRNTRLRPVVPIRRALFALGGHLPETNRVRPYRRSRRPHCSTAPLQALIGVRGARSSRQRPTKPAHLRNGQRKAGSGSATESHGKAGTSRGRCQPALEVTFAGIPVPDRRLRPVLTQILVHGSSPSNDTLLSPAAYGPRCENGPFLLAACSVADLIEQEYAALEFSNFRAPGVAPGPSTILQAVLQALDSSTLDASAPRLFAAPRQPPRRPWQGKR